MVLAYIDQGTSLMEKSSISMAMFNSYVRLPEAYLDILVGGLEQVFNVS